MADFSNLVPDIQVEIPETPTFVAERQIIRAARELCEEARVWRVNFDISTVANIATVSLVSGMPEDTELVDVISIKHEEGGEPLTATTYARMDKDYTDWRSDTDLNATQFVLEANNVIRLYPTPSDTVIDNYHVRVAVKPLLTTAVIDNRTLNKYSELLISGALARMYAIPRKPWTDLKLAGFHRGIFYGSFAAARAEATDEFQTGVARKVQYGGI